MAIDCAAAEHGRLIKMKERKFTGKTSGTMIVIKRRKIWQSRLAG